MRKYLRSLLITSLSSCLTFCVFDNYSDAGGCRRRAICSRGLPDREYQSGIIPQRATVASHSAPELEVPGELTKMKLFQPLAEKLTVGDCSLSQIWMQVYPNGHCVLSFRASNSAVNAEPAQPPGAINVTPTPEKVAKTSAKKATEVVTAPVRFHRIGVTVRLFSGRSTTQPADKKLADGVQLTKFPVTPFYLTAGDEQPYSIPVDLSISPRQYSQATQAEFELEVDPAFPVVQDKPQTKKSGQE